MQPHFPKITAFPVLAELANEFNSANVYLVGGAVRDILLGKKVTDIDIVVQGVSADLLEEFLATRGRVVLAGKNFGVWKFHEIGRPKDEVYDIALPRTEFSLHRLGAYRDFSVQTDPMLPIEEDLGRRDFTVNAMAWNLAKSELIDPHGGQDDLARELIRTVGAPAERFQEDYSRLLRTLRFSLQLDFAIEKQTLETARAMMANVNNELQGRRVLPYEVVAEEFLKSFLANPAGALVLWESTGATAELVPELLRMRECPQPENWHTEGDVWKHTLLALKALSSEEFKRAFPSRADIELIVAVLFHDIGKPYTLKTPERDGVDRIRFDGHDQVGAKIAETVLNRLRVSSPPDISVKPERVAWLVRYHMVAVHGEVGLMRPVTFERYFFNAREPSQNLVKLLFADGLATVNQEGKPLIDRYEKVMTRIAAIKKATGSHGTKLAKPLLTGQDVLHVLKAEPGPRVGEILELVRQKQLTGELTSRTAALEFLATVR